MDFLDHSRLFQNTFSERLAPLRTVQSQLYETSQTAQMFAEELESCETQLNCFKSSLNAKKNLLPSLEEDKKQAIANRAFGEAKEIAAEIKDVNDQVAAAQDTTALLRAAVNKARKDLNEALETEEKLYKELFELESVLREDQENLLHARQTHLETLLADSILRPIVQAELTFIRSQIESANSQ